MTTRLAIVAAIPVVGLVLLLGALLALGNEQVHVRYGGRDYAGGTVVARAPGARPTEARVEGKQVWARPGRADRIWLQLADGRFQVYRLDE